MLSLILLLTEPCSIDDEPKLGMWKRRFFHLITTLRFKSSNRTIILHDRDDDIAKFKVHQFNKKYI